MTKLDIRDRLNSPYKNDDSLGLWIDPLLEQDQIGELTIDLRLGCDFLVSVVTRRPFIGIISKDEHFRPMQSYFQPTRRELGERFILYPNQTVLAVSLEYLGIPSDCYANLLTRSSYSRFGISISGTIVEPGYRGCLSVELFNHGNNPIELIVGTRIFQMNLIQLPSKIPYAEKKRKYLGSIRPEPSRAIEDSDLEKLIKISEDTGRRKQN